MDAFTLLLMAGVCAGAFLLGALLGIRYGRRREREYWSGRFRAETRRLEAEMSAEKIECWVCPVCGKASGMESRACTWCFASRPEACRSKTLSRLEYQNQASHLQFPEL